jgi:hypothetical protein
MSVTIHLHKTHRQFAEGLASVDTTGRTVGECLADLVTRYPGLKPQVFDRDGNLLKTIEIYLNMTSAYPDEIAKQTQDGDQIHITLMLAGG